VCLQLHLANHGSAQSV